MAWLDNRSWLEDEEVSPLNQDDEDEDDEDLDERAFGLASVPTLVGDGVHGRVVEDSVFEGQAHDVAGTEAEKFLVESGCRWLAKPFRLGDLLKIVREGLS